MEMTNKPTGSSERAGKIADELWQQGPHSHLNPKQVAMIAAAIDEAVDDAVRMAVIESFGPQYRKQFLDGWTACREEAAKIADDGGYDCPEGTHKSIANHIRLMKGGAS